MTDMDLTQVFELLLSAAKSGSWMYALAALLMAATWGFRKYLAPRWSFFRTDEGGFLLNLALAFFGALVTAGPAVAFSWAMLATTGKVALAAVGGYTALKKFLVPMARRFLWPLVERLLAKLGIKTGAARIAEAEAAGKAAVKSKPGPGAAGVAGAPQDVP